MQGRVERRKVHRGWGLEMAKTVEMVRLEGSLAMGKMVDFMAGRADFDRAVDIGFEVSDDVYGETRRGAVRIDRYDVQGAVRKLHELSDALEEALKGL